MGNLAYRDGGLGCRDGGLGIGTEQRVQGWNRGCRDGAKKNRNCWADTKAG